VARRRLARAACDSLRPLTWIFLLARDDKWSLDCGLIDNFVRVLNENFRDVPQSEQIYYSLGITWFIKGVFGNSPASPNPSISLLKRDSSVAAGATNVWCAPPLLQDWEPIYPIWPNRSPLWHGRFRCQFGPFGSIRPCIERAYESQRWRPEQVLEEGGADRPLYCLRRRAGQRRLEILLEEQVGDGGDKERGDGISCSQTRARRRGWRCLSRPTSGGAHE
jgi:hypothetical protein